jgi:putative transposase
MPRPLRAAPGGVVYHVLNRGNARRRIFEHAGDYAAFEDVLAEMQQRVPMRILSWCLMPNHWHLVLWPFADGDLSNYMRLVTLTHTQRWHAHRTTAGTGHLYQGRFKSFAVQQDRHFLTVCRYVERNALQARLVENAQDWRWCSLWRAQRIREHPVPYIEPWPVQRPEPWVTAVNAPLAAAELHVVRHSSGRGTPYGERAWTREMAERLGLESTLRPRGRPSRARDANAEKGPDPF